MTLAEILAHLCDGDPTKLVAFLRVFPDAAHFQAVFAVFGTRQVLAGFLDNRYQGDFALLRADYDKLGAVTLGQMIEGTARARAKVGAAVEEACRRIDAQLPAVTDGEPEGLRDARRARATVEARWAALPAQPTDRALRGVLDAIKAADAAVEVALKVTRFPALDPAVQKRWDAQRAALRDRLGKCRAAILAVRGRALPGTDYAPVTERLASVVNTLSELDAGGVDEAWLQEAERELTSLEEEVDRLGAAVDEAILRARVRDLLEGPFDELGDALPGEFVADREHLVKDPLAASDARLTELEKVLPKYARAYVDTRGMEQALRTRIEKLYGEDGHPQLDEKLTELAWGERERNWPLTLKGYQALERAVARVEEKAAKRDANKLQAYLQTKQQMAAIEQADAAALAWGQAAFAGNVILTAVWQATHLNRKKCEKNARIAGNNHSWEDVAAAIQLWIAHGNGAGVVSNLHVPGQAPQAKWEKDLTRKVAQANFICTWSGVTVDIHVTLDIRSFLRNGRWDEGKLPPELEQFKP